MRRRPRPFPWWTAAAVASLLASCGEQDLPDDAPPANPPEIATVQPAAQALAGAHIPAVDPAPMHEAELEKVLEARPSCSFRYTASGRPVLAARLQLDGRPESGVVKLNGSLVPLQPATSADGVPGVGFVLVSGPVRLRVRPDPQAPGWARGTGEPAEADMLFEIGQQLRVGYRGFIDCREPLPGAAPREG